tara:strand:+ start:2620 stop:2979 length:360 start_codon:yes stop_codon:yes gene_type:complete
MTTYKERETLTMKEMQEYLRSNEKKINWCRDQIRELLEWQGDQELDRLRRELKEETEESPLESSSCWLCNEQFKTEDPMLDLDFIPVGFCDEFDTFYHKKCAEGKPTLNDCPVCAVEMG